MREASLITVFVGLVLIGASFLWPDMVGGRVARTEEQARAYTQAAGEFHRRAIEAGIAHEPAGKRESLGQGTPEGAIADARLANAAAGSTSVDPKTATPDRLSAELAAAKARYDSQRAAYEDALSRGQGAAAIIRWVGIGLVTAGFVGTTLARPRGASS